MAKIATATSWHDDSFIPNAANTRQFRNALGSFTTGVTVITASSSSSHIGMTANSFSSLSLDPPLVLWSPAKNSARHDAFITTEHFCINVLSVDQTDLCISFAKSGNDFSQFDYDVNQHGVPLILGALSRFECERYAIHDGGDHSLIIGKVKRVHHLGGEPLCFSQGIFGGFIQHSE